jgi:cytochrome c
VTVTRVFGVSLAAASLVAPDAFAAADPIAGAVVFNSQWGVCHTVDGHDRVGPYLDGVMGRKAGTVRRYNYSVANRDSSLTWTEVELMAYLGNPRKVVPGTKILHAGLHDAQKRADLNAYSAILKK